MALKLGTQVATFFKRFRAGRPEYQEFTKEQQASLRSVCIFMGPYRNLTTLTSALLNLHPHCQVLNHAAMRVLDDDAINFLSHYSDERFGRFCSFAIEESQGGKRGDYGGSITLSHAFDHEVMSSAYEERYGGNLRKDEVRSIVWKDSQRLTNFLRDNKLLDQALESNEKIRFLMPIRNPMDCAISNSNSRKSEHLLSRGGSLHDVLGAVCREIAWFQQQKQRLPTASSVSSRTNSTKPHYETSQPSSGWRPPRSGWKMRCGSTRSNPPTITMRNWSPSTGRSSNGIL